ncbi:lysosomal alpha-mannosidase-like [Diorhabda carinulata]|uniref:lysosomal alpha-mannosidase-like n=1 Tax=Diorhabda carinulata TaxID=1163345 RepID=UPI0025A021EE|nr:lysosomal alpha-mannosidase-like [Diorhabda carinulata]
MKQTIIIISTILFFNISTVFSTCALKACQNVDPKKINVHLIPHSHDDVGWLKTVEDYFYGEHNDIQNIGVQYVLDSILQALDQDASRRYIQVETAYFWKWWKLQSDDKRQRFKNFVENGRIEMIGGGWSMNDEACTSYQSIINQFTWGLRILNDTLGECGRPKIGWQIDPFGHSREQASIFKQMGYDAVFFTRLSTDERNARKLTKDLEFMWNSNDNFENSEIFTSIMDSYYAPNDFCWDYLQCSSDAINDDPDSFDYNLDKKVEEFSEKILNYSSYFRTNNILFAMGGDFQYQAAEINYLNMDKLIKGFKNNENYNVFYSTPSCYVQAVKSQKPSLTSSSEDFFPYNENNHTYWAGYFTSRSTLKRFERIGNNILQAAQQLNAFAKMSNIITGEKAENNLRSLRETVGTMQHHDAITGTEKERVAKDYARILTDGIHQTELSIGNILSNLLKINDSSDTINLPFSTCLLTNISVCDNSMKDKVLIAIYNPLPKDVYYNLRLPVQNANYNFTGVDGDVSFELVDHMKYPLESPYRSSDVELVATDQIPPMGMKLYYLQKLDDTPSAIKHVLQTGFDPIKLEKQNSKLTFDPKTRKQYISVNKKSAEINQKYMYYNSHNGTADNITSGAYVFRPMTESEAQNAEDDNRSVYYLDSSRNSEIIEKINEYIIQTIRLRSEGDLDYVEYDWMIGPLDNKTVDTVNGIGKEVIVRYSLGSEYINDDVFYTDSNSRQLIKRFRNNIKYNDTSKEAVASNYYPVTSIIALNGTGLSLVIDRSQGGTSLKSNEIELMLHRRTLKDDHKGVDESLEEMEFGNYIVTRGQHYLIASTSNKKYQRLLALNKLTQPWVLVADATADDMKLENLKSNIHFKWSRMNGLPLNLNVLNFEPWKDDTFLLRIEHIFEKDEDEELSKPATLQLKSLFSPYVISSIQELNLGANAFIDADIEENNYKITLQPMEIRTFLVTFEYFL